MPHYQIEMLWKCRVCQAHRINKGLSKHCAGCGHPKDDQDEEMFPEDISEANALMGEEKKKAEAGPDFKCKYCNSLQSALNQCCTECGADKKTGAKAWHTKELSISQDVKTGEKSEIESQEVEISNTGVVTESPAQPEPEAVAPAPRHKPVQPIWIIIPAAIIILGSLLYFIFRTEVVNVRVTATHWDHQVAIEKYQLTPEEGWTPSPNAVNTRSTGQRVHHHDHIKVGSHEEKSQKPYDCNCKTIKGECSKTPRNCKSNKNGTADCTGGDTICAHDSEKCETCYKDIIKVVDDYEDPPVYQTWYAWYEWEWKYNRTVIHQCDEPARKCDPPSWATEKELGPPFPLASGEQERNSRSENYKVVFSEPRGKTHDWKSKSEAEFLQHPVGSISKIRVGIAHGVEILP